MSTEYKESRDVPNDVLARRLRELSNHIVNRKGDFLSEFTMRIPAEVDRDADIVLSESADRIEARTDTIPVPSAARFVGRNSPYIRDALKEATEKVGNLDAFGYLLQIVDWCVEIADQQKEGKVRR